MKRFPRFAELNQVPPQRENTRSVVLTALQTVMAPDGDGQRNGHESRFAVDD